MGLYAPTSDRHPKLKKPFIVILFLFVLVSVCLAAWYWHNKHSDSVSVQSPKSERLTFTMNTFPITGCSFKASFANESICTDDPEAYADQFNVHARFVIMDADVTITESMGYDCVTCVHNPEEPKVVVKYLTIQHVYSMKADE